MEKKIADIRASASDANEASFASCQTPGMCEFHPITTKDVIKVIASSPSKQCSLDVLPTWLMKKAIPLLAPFIARMFNHSFAIGRFLSTWKLEPRNRHLRTSDRSQIYRSSQRFFSVLPTNN